MKILIEFDLPKDRKKFEVYKDAEKNHKAIFAILKMLGSSIEYQKKALKIISEMDIKIP